MQFYFSCTNNSHQYNVLFIAVDDLNDWVGFMDGNQQTRTLLDLCDLPLKKTNEGRSITSVLKNPNIDWPYPSITTMGYGNHAIRSKTGDTFNMKMAPKNYTINDQIYWNGVT